MYVVSLLHHSSSYVQNTGFLSTFFTTNQAFFHQPFYQCFFHQSSAVREPQVTDNIRYFRSLIASHYFSVYTHRLGLCMAVLTVRCRALRTLCLQVCCENLSNYPGMQVRQPAVPHSHISPRLQCPTSRPYATPPHEL